MAKLISAGLIIVCCIVIIASFFAPWARAKVNVTKVASGLVSSAESTLKNAPFAGKFISGLNTTTTVIGSLGDIEVKTEISGYDIPTMINKKSSKTALSLAQVFAKETEGLDRKSMLVYLLPLFAVSCIALTVIGLKNKLVIIPMALVSGAISMIGLYKLFTVNLSSLSIEITIMNGLWQTLYGYLLIFVLAIIWFIMDRRER